MDTETAKIYQARIKQHEDIIAELEEQGDYETAEHYREKLSDLQDEYSYLRDDEAAFQRYLKQIKGDVD